MAPLFYNFWKNIAECFSLKNLKYHVLAVVLTYIIVSYGLDWKYFNFFAGSTLSYVLFSSAIVGGLLPIFLPIIILLYGKIRKNISILNTGFALGQSAILGYLISSFYKVWSGRAAPPLNHLDNKFLDFTNLNKIGSVLPDTSRIFHLGFWGNGIFWGWPSSHTTVAFAMAFAIWTLFPKNKTVRALALIYALYIGFGVSMTIHWFSDFAAGAIIGTLIGVIVGRSFKKRITNS